MNSCDHLVKVYSKIVQQFRVLDVFTNWINFVLRYDNTTLIAINVSINTQIRKVCWYLK